MEIPEALFDLDYPGHYMRRIKSVSISIPCIAGPYTTISCELRQTKSKYRKTAVLANVNSYAENPDPWHNAGTGYDSNRFNYIETGTAIATSTAQNDSGIFELNFKDERYLPFEGTGAVSKWELSLPESYRQFDYETISDVIFHIKYTAKEGGEILKSGAVNNLANMFKTLDNTVLYRYFSLRHEFSNEWYRYSKAKKNEEPGATFDMVLRPDDFPQFCQGKKIEITGWYLQLNPKESNVGLVVNGPGAGINEVLLKGREGATINLTQPQYITVPENGTELALNWTFTCDYTTEDLADFYLVAHYKISDVATPPFTDCSRTVILQDFNGNNVTGYPAGVFDRHGKYVGMADTRAQYATLWNNAPGNIGFAVITPTSTDASFLLVGDPEDTILTLRAMAAFQFDFSGSDVLDSISAPENSYIDFGDGTVVFTEQNATLPLNTKLYRVNAPNTALSFYIAGTGLFDRTYEIKNYSCAYQHTYAHSGSYKVSVMFNLDADYILDTDNMDGTPLTTFAANLRGYLPVNTRTLEFTSTQNASFNTLKNIKNRADVVPNLWRFSLRSGANNTIPGAVDFGTWDFPEVRCLDFGTFHYNQAWLYTPVLIKDLIGTTNLPAKYPKLHSIGFMGNKYSNDLNLAIPNIRFGMFGSYHGYDPQNLLPAGAVDKIMIQLDSVKNDTGGQLLFGSEQPTTTAGQTAMQSLQNKGMSISFI